MTPATTKRPVETVDILVGEGSEESVEAIETSLGSLHNQVTVMSEPEQLKQYLLEAVRGYNERVPDLVILDRELLGERCWGFIDQIRAEPGFQHTMLAIMTDEREKDTLDRALQAGVDWFIPKPLTIENLADVIHDMDHLHMAVVRVRMEG